MGVQAHSVANTSETDIRHETHVYRCTAFALDFIAQGSAEQVRRAVSTAKSLTPPASHPFSSGLLQEMNHEVHHRDDKLGTSRGQGRVRLLSQLEAWHGALLGMQQVQPKAHRPAQPLPHREVHQVCKDRCALVLSH